MMPQAALGAAANAGLPQHVIDAGNYLRANGIEVTPRSMYVASVLGPQRAVDLFNRTGSMSSAEVPSADAATRGQVLDWVRQLRPGTPAAAGPPPSPDIAASAPPAPARFDPGGGGNALPDDWINDAGLPSSASAQPVV